MSTTRLQRLPVLSAHQIRLEGTLLESRRIKSKGARSEYSGRKGAVVIDELADLKSFM